MLSSVLKRGERRSEGAPLGSTKIRSVLVADDSDVARHAVVVRLKAVGLRPVEARSAKSAKEVDPAGIACALVDLDLGDGNGVDLAKALRKRAEELPVAFFSAGATAEIVDQAKRLGPVFTKPEELEDALAWVTAHTKT